MADPKIRLNTEWLSDCAGCHIALVDLHEKILDVFEAIEIQHCPVLTDIKGYPHAAVGLVSGAIRNEHDRHLAQRMRESCDRIVAWGTCAVYGGIPGAAMAHSQEDILRTVYGKGCAAGTKCVPTCRVDKLEKTVAPLDEVIEVDLYLPGCPPHPTFIFQALLALLENRPPKATRETVCAHCKRTMIRTSVDRVRRNHEGIPDRDTCFLSQGYVCLGSVTLDRCLAPCPGNGLMCTGCAGPSPELLTEPNRDIRTEVSDRISRLTSIPKAAALAEIERSSKSHYSYAMAARMIGEKPTFNIRKWIAETEEEE